jgi:hypothetical protein
LSGCGDLRIVKELNRQFFLLPSSFFFVFVTQEGVAAVARRQHGLKVEDEGLLKDFIVIFVFLGVLCTVCCFF